MGLLNQWLEVNFGRMYGGLATVGYRLYRNDGTDVVGRTTTGVIELGTGVYGVVVPTIADDVTGIEWDTGGGTPVYATEDIKRGTFITTYEQGMIWVNTISGNDVNDGTFERPVLTVARAKAACLALGTTRIHLEGWWTLTESLVGYQIWGGDTYSDGIDFNGQAVGQSEFYYLILWGSPPKGLIEGYLAHNCFFYATGGGGGNLNLAYDQCAFGGRRTDPWPVEENVTITFDRCYSTGTDSLDPNTGARFNMVAGQPGTPMDVHFTKWSGNIQIINLTDGVVWIEGEGKLTISASCTGGTIRVAGDFEIIDASAGTIVLDFTVDGVLTPSHGAGSWLQGLGGSINLEAPLEIEMSTDDLDIEISLDQEISIEVDVETTVVEPIEIDVSIQDFEIEVSIEQEISIEVEVE